jgi:phosphatidylglycerol---prolipoprotein diacylglyceryl transferase
MDLSFIIWNGSPEIFGYGQIALRWYGLLFALGFLVSQQILYYMHKKEGKPEREVDTLTIIMVIATILGARLGHVIFYQPEIIWEDPLGILLPFEFTPKFRFIGLQGLASHGGAIAIFIALWWYARKRKLAYLHVLDRIAILVALTGAFIRMGNFFNSEIIGKPTDMPTGIVFSSRFTEAVTNKNLQRNPIEEIGIQRVKDRDSLTTTGYVPLTIYLFFKPDVNEGDMRSYMENRVKTFLINSSEHFYIDPTVVLNFYFTRQDNGSLAVKVPVAGIARHPAQLYESISCVFLFLLLFWIWKKHNGNPPEGRIFGLFMVILWSLRFSYEFLKENQVNFENSMPLNMGQILSIPLFIAGVIILIRSYKNQPPAKA